VVAGCGILRPGLVVAGCGILRPGLVVAGCGISGCGILSLGVAIWSICLVRRLPANISSAHIACASVMASSLVPAPNLVPWACTSGGGLLRQLRTWPFGISKAGARPRGMRANDIDALTDLPPSISFGAIFGRALSCVEGRELSERPLQCVEGRELSEPRLAKRSSS
jgi:hypothetical protein